MLIVWVQHPVLTYCRKSKIYTFKPFFKYGIFLIDCIFYTITNMIDYKQKIVSILTLKNTVYFTRKKAHFFKVLQGFTKKFWICQVCEQHAWLKFQAFHSCKLYSPNLYRQAIDTFISNHVEVANVIFLCGNHWFEHAANIVSYADVINLKIGLHSSQLLQKKYKLYVKMVPNSSETLPSTTCRHSKHFITMQIHFL